MKIECPGCNKVFNIPDERIPTGKSFKFPCPSCKTIIKSGGPQDEEKDYAKRIQEAKDRIEQEKGGNDLGSKKDAKALKDKIYQKLMGQLPPMPQVIVKAQEIMSDPDSGLKELATVIATDQAIATRALKMANSAYYGMRGQVTSIGEAAVILGLKTLSEIIMMAGALNLLGKNLKGYNMDSGALWQHSVSVGIGAKLIAKQVHPALSNDAFTAGIIHDIGMIMLDKHLFDRKEAFDSYMADTSHSLTDAETEILGFDHSEIGSDVCKKWGLPAALTSAIRYHHYPSRSSNSELAYLIYIADKISFVLEMGKDNEEQPLEIEPDILETAGISQEDLDKIMEEVKQSVEKMTKRVFS